MTTQQINELKDIQQQHIALANAINKFLGGVEVDSSAPAKKTRVSKKQRINKFKNQEKEIWKP